MEETMDPATIAAAVIPVVITWFGKAGKQLLDKTAQAASEGALEKIKQIYETIRSRFSGDAFADQALQRVGDDPDSVPRRKTLEAVLTERLGEDAEFAATLQGLIEELASAGGTSIVAIESGVVAGGNVTQRGRFVAGRDLTINDRDDD
jgi:hypothetical protein